MANRWGNNGNSDRLYFGGSKITADGDWSHEIKKMLAPWKKSYDQSRQHIKKHRPYFASKCLSSESYGFPVVKYRCESWTIKKGEHWRIDAFVVWCWRRLLRVPWTARRSNQSIPKGDQSWLFIGRTDVETETPILWPPDAKNWLIGKEPDGGKDWRQEEKGTTEDEMVGWHHRLNGHEFEQASGVGNGQGSLACFSPWGRKESDTTEKPNWTELNWKQAQIHISMCWK